MSTSTWRMTIEDYFFALMGPLLLCKGKDPRNAKQKNLSTWKASDEEIVKLAISSPKVDANTFYVAELGRNNGGNVAQIASDAVAKSTVSTNELELLSTELVRTSTAIPVPKCERLVMSEHGSWLVMEFIAGRTLHDVWPELGWWKRLRVAITLRYYVHELRSLPARIGAPSVPGPPAIDGEPQICSGRMFTSDGSGPFSSYRDMARWYQNRLLVMQNLRKEGLDVEPFDDSSPLVFTHQDLHMRNIILGEDGQLWVIDWADAGWYPSWFEAASMQRYVNSHPDTAPSWSKWISFIAGSCEKPGQLPFICAIAYSLEILQAKIINLVSDELTGVMDIHFHLI